MCTCRFLTEDDFPQIVKTFDEAFADYFLKMSSSSEHWLRSRATKNGVAYNCSVGAFFGERMVGLTLIGLDDWRGVPAAFDAATGIIPDFRGKGLARQIFEHSLPRLRERGIRKFLLEVLQVNEPAIKAYQKVGFKVTREFDCYDLKPDKAIGPSDLPYGVEIRPLERNELLQFAGETDWYPSWENSFAAIQRIPDDITVFGAWSGDELVGEIVYYPLLSWVVSLVVKRPWRRQGIARALLGHMISNLESGWTLAKFNNVWHDDTATTDLLKNCGFGLYASQFEMEMDI